MPSKTTKPSTSDWARLFGARSAPKNVKIDGTRASDWARVFGGASRTKVAKKKIAPSASDWAKLLGGRKK